MVDEVDVTFDFDLFGDVVVEEGEVLRTDVLDVLERTGVEVVDADHFVILGQQVVT